MRKCFSNPKDYWESEHLKRCSYIFLLLSSCSILHNNEATKQILLPDFFLQTFFYCKFTGQNLGEKKRIKQQVHSPHPLIINTTLNCHHAIQVLLPGTPLALLCVLLLNFRPKTNNCTTSKLPLISSQSLRELQLSDTK